MINKLIKETFDLFIKEMWLKRIDKEEDKYNRINGKANRQAHIVHAMVDRYNEIYKDDPLVVVNKKSDSPL